MVGRGCAHVIAKMSFVFDVPISGWDAPREKVLNLLVRSAYARAFLNFCVIPPAMR